MRHHAKLLALVLVLGIIDAAYLTFVHFVPGALYCPTIATAINCENVLTSQLSNVFGFVPLAVLGLMWFVASLLMLSFGYNEVIKNIWMLFGVGGIVYSLVGQTVIGKVCIYCSLLDVLLCLSIGMFLYMKR